MPAQDASPGVALGEIRAALVTRPWIATAALELEMAGPEAAGFTPWFRLEWERIWREHRPAVLALQ